jgi:hypothetical protein
MAFVRLPIGRGNRDDFIVTGLVQPLDTVVAWLRRWGSASSTWCWPSA